ncbi:MAG: efflux RND transporter periplasmic adaptor subunit [Bryobacteraceae bacterium]|nr:efflux RND transporter periplasmic adaptor subunit [Bryobacteraceae bacterium]MDW8376767.1 efflux RND transporter periplasmic adaptor subunit [Bryobacterales bacterium]
MKRKTKITLGVVVLALLAGGGYAGYHYSKKGVVVVQTGRVVRQDLTAIVTASGEIKPRNYINIGTNAVSPSRITEILVSEGQAVRKGQILAKLESVQPEAEVAAQRAALSTAEAEAAASEAAVRAADENIRTAEASLERAKADLERSRIFFERAKRLWEDKLISRQEYDQRATEYAAVQAAVREAEARIHQLQAQRQQAVQNLAAAQRRIALSQANLKRATDVLQRTLAIAPIDGVVTNLPVRVGETVVPGIQNSPASLIMTIADMSLITAEVKVDETDIVNVKLDQEAEVTIDALPNRTFRGRVIEIGNTAILRSTGLAASQSAISSQEAKDFKVVVALNNPPAEIRPGLSCTAKIITAVRRQTLTVPIQALTVRRKGDLEPERKSGVQAAAPLDPAVERERKQELQGVFVIANGVAMFKKVETGITGATDIEVLSGVNEGEEIITGSYKVLRTLRNEAKVKVENNKPPLKAES